MRGIARHFGPPREGGFQWLFDQVKGGIGVVSAESCAEFTGVGAVEQWLNLAAPEGVALASR